MTQILTTEVQKKGKRNLDFPEVVTTQKLMTQTILGKMMRTRTKNRNLRKIYTGGKTESSNIFFILCVYVLDKRLRAAVSNVIYMDFYTLIFRVAVNNASFLFK